MKQLLLLTASVALLQIPGQAAPCTTATLSVYIAMGSAGCTLGNLVISHVDYQAKAKGGAAKITPDEIVVTPLLPPAPVATVGLEFAAPWSVQADQGQESLITYRALSSATTGAVNQLRLDGSGFAAGMLSSVQVNEDVATPKKTYALKIFEQCDDVCRSKTSDTALVIPAAPPVAVVDKVTLASKQGGASLKDFTDWFVTCAPCAD